LFFSMALHKFEFLLVYLVNSFLLEILKNVIYDRFVWIFDGICLLGKI
jgi:hypothetical protein